MNVQPARQAAIMFEDRQEVERLRGYFSGGEQPDVFIQDGLGDRVDTLTGRLDGALATGEFPVKVSTADIHDLLLPILSQVISDAYGDSSPAELEATRPHTDYRQELGRHLTALAKAS